jgi:hypothetical protein
MRSVFRLLLILGLLPVLLLLTGCEDSNNQPAAEEPFEWDPSWGPAPEETGMAGANGEHEVIRDTAYVVVEKRQAGGQLAPDPSDVSAFDGRPRMKRTPLESMIIVEGNMTGQRSAYLLPQGDYNVVQVGHRLQESTLGRWESTTESHIPPPPQPEDRQRSRTGGAAEQFAY